MEEECPLYAHTRLRYPIQRLSNLIVEIESWKQQMRWTLQKHNWQIQALMLEELGKSSSSPCARHSNVRGLQALLYKLAATSFCRDSTQQACRGRRSHSLSRRHSHSHSRQSVPLEQRGKMRAAYPLLRRWNNTCLRPRELSCAQTASKVWLGTWHS